ncbi:MAG: hypothetical protein V3R84_02120 [Acidimicrobiia bacterium]
MGHRFALVVLVVVLAACGGDNDQGIASIDGTPATTASSAEPDAEAALLEFTQCLRDQGLDIDDPQADADGNLVFTPQNVDVDELLAARDDCSEYLSGVTLEAFGFDRTGLEDDLFEYAVCMRANGFDMPDPDLDNTLRRLLGQGDQNAEGFAGIGPFGDIDIENPQFISADAVCRPDIFADFEPPQDSP